ncbi:Protein C10 [Durusdinium trenchii]|uniref:Protein C10 n=1 Tax=Durusdinium trenchii TaxID=1381693 RepID=A0ABP0ICK5_9DINO
MDGFLRALFLEKGFTEDQLDQIEAKDRELRRVGDLAAGASSEDDARAWAEELGLSSRVARSRFVQSWMEARSGSFDAAGYSAPAPLPPEPIPEPIEKYMEPEPKFVEEVIEDPEESGDDWVKVSRPAPRPVETRVALSYIDGEPVSKPGGVSDMLRSSLRSHGLTSMEVSQLEQTLEARSCKALAVAAATFEGAMRLARLGGIQSKVSQENFARAWHQAAASMMALDGASRSKSAKLADLVKEQDWEACTNVLMQRMKVSQPKDLLPLMRGLLHHVAEEARVKSEAEKQAKVLPYLLGLYGPEAVAEAERSTTVAQAEWRYSWMVRSFFDAKTLQCLQAEVLKAYEANEFQAACEELNDSWDSSMCMPLDRKMHSIEAVSDRSCAAAKQRTKTCWRQIGQAESA